MPSANLRPEQPNTTIWSCPSARWRRLVLVIAAVFASAGSLSAAINSPTNAIGTVGLPFSYQISTTETATNYGASGLPIGIVAPGSNGLITGLPQSAGTYTSTVTAAQTNGSVSNKVVIKINPPASPELVSPLTFFGMQGELLRYPLLSVPSHSNVPTTFVVSGPPSGSSLTSNVTTNTAYTNVLVTNYFIDSASLAASGSFVVPVVTRNQGGTNTNNVTFVISPKTNPVITSASNASAIVGVPFTFDVTAINSPRGFRVASVALGTNTNATANVTNGVLTNGLSFSNVTNGSYVIGRIFGTPAIATNVTLGLQATNSTLPAALQTLTINVGSPQPTVILTQPLGEANYVLGSSFFLNAQAFDRVPDTIVPSSVGFTAGGLPVSGTVTRLGEYYGVEFYPANPAAFPVVASAQNSLGQTVTSSPLPMTPATPQSAFPSVSMLPLFPGPQIQAGGTVTLRARAFSPQTAIQRVEFYVNKVFVGATTATAATNEYQLPWETPVTPGNFEIHARVVSVNIAAGGLGPGTPPYYASTITRAPVVLNTVSGVLPSVAIVSPTDGAQLPFNVATRVVASANVFGGSIQQVQFYRDGQPLGAADTTAPYSVDFIPNSYGSYQLFAIATTSAGLINISPTVTVTVPELVGADPTVTLSAPSAAKTGELLTLAADASDADGNIVSVQFLANGVPLPTPDATANPNPDLAAPYRYAFAPSAPGRYELIARATDNSGNVTDSEVRILTVSVGTPPTASITAPSASPPHAMKINETVEIRADASAAAGRNIARVEFLLNGRAPLPTSALTPSVLTAGPYRFTWRADNTGQYAVVVRVTDNLGNITDSTPITINVTQGTAPTVAISTPLSTDTLTPGVPATIVAVPEGKSGSVTQVEFFVNGVSVGVSAPPNAPPYVASFTPSAVGPYTLMARVTDSLGNVADSAAFTVNAANPTGAQPLVTLGSVPSVTNLVTGSELYLNATATNADGSVLSGAGAGVTFLVNGLPVPGTVNRLKPNSYSARFTVGNSALYTIQAVATNGAGNKAASTQSIITVRPRQNDLPQVQVLELLPGASTVAGGNIALRAQALFPAAAAANARVQFYGNGVLLGESAAPVGSIYSFNWTVPNALDGEVVEITARATADNFTTTVVAGTTTTFAGSIISSNTPTVVNLGTGPVPVVSITAPSAAGSIPLGVPTNINVSATVTGGTIGAVDFYVNGTLIGTDATAPFSLPWTPTSTGTYTLGAIATSNAGIAKAASSTVSVTSGNPIASVAIQAPASPHAMKINETVTLRANATAGTGRNIAAVEYYFNGLLVGTARPNNGPYTLNYLATRAGSYSVIARAIDDLGNEKDSTPITINVTQGTAPTVSITTPAASATLTPGIPVSIIADVEGKSGTVTQTEFFVNGVRVGSATAEPYLTSFTPPAAGPYEIFARVTDSLGNVADSAKRTVTAVKPAGLQPLVLLSQPLANSRFVAGSAIYLNATATKADGTVDPGMALKFLVNGVEQAGVTVDKSKGQFSVPFILAQAGTTYSVQAVATQTGGVQGAAAPVNVATLGAQNPLPQVEILDLLPGTSTTAGGIVPLRAQAQLFGADPAQTKVQFFADGWYVGDGALQSDGTYLLNWKTPRTAASYSSVRARVLAPNATITSGGGGGQEQAIVYLASVFSSNFLTINTAIGVPPSVKLVAPGDGSSITLGQPLTLRATAGTSPGVASIRVTNGGSGYKTAPTVTIAPPSAGGTRAKAVAVLGTGANAGSVVRIDVTDAGSAYAAIPVVSFAGGGGSGAAAAALVRTPTTAGVRFYVNGNPLGSIDTESPYETLFTPVSQGSYEIAAVAVSTDGLISDPDSVVVIAAGGQGPEVDITNPKTALNYVPGTTIPVAATAIPKASGARVASMQFFVDGVSLGLPDTQAPFNATLVLPGAGPYKVTAIATDNFGNVGSESVSISSSAPAGGSPFVTINYPTPNPLTLPAGSEIYVNASGSAPTGRKLKEIRFYVDGILQKTEAVAAAQMTAAYLYRQADNANHSVVAEVVDEFNNASFSTPLEISVPQTLLYPPPTISLLPIQGIPSGGVTVGTSVYLVAEANAGLQAVTNVDFYANGVFVGSVSNNGDSPVAGLFRAVYEWKPGFAGDFVITAAARNVSRSDDIFRPDEYSVISNGRSLKTILPVSPPTISFVSPTNGSKFAPNTTIVATVNALSAPGRRVQSVAFYVNGEPVLNDTEAPYTLSYRLSALGSYSIAAVVTDSASQTASNSIAVEAVSPSGAEPVVAITQPVPESNYVFGSVLPLNLSATDTGGIVGGSTFFYLNGAPLLAQAAFSNLYVASYAAASTTTDLQLFASAADGDGNTAVSGTTNLRFVPAGRQLPLAEILELPAGLATVAGGIVPLRAEVQLFGADAAQTSVQFFADGAYLGNGTLQADGTYLFNWKTPKAARAYSAVRARVVAPNATVTTGGGGGQPQQTTVYFASVFSSNFITINTAAGVPPVVNIVQPADGFTATLGQPLTLRASAGGSPGLASIRITNGGAGYTSAPAVTVAAPPAGGTQAKAVAVLGTGANAGQVVRVDVTDAGSGYTARPSATFAAAPAGGTRATGTAVLRTPNVASVQFLVNGEPVAGGFDAAAPYETVFTPQSQGSYVLSAIARSTDGLVSVADSVVVTVTSGLAPKVNITNPTVAAGTPANYVPGTTVPVAASAQPVTAGARIASMQFFVNGVSLGLPDTQAPYEQPFTIPGAGPYSIVAVATDSFGNTGSSTVQINSAIPAGGAPFVQIEYPTPNPIFLLPGSEIFVNAEAVVPSGRTVKEIRFYLDGTRVKTATNSLQASYLYRQADSLGHVIVAEVVDSANNAFYSVPLQIFPQTSFTFPAPTIDLQPIQGSAGGTTVGSSVFLVAESNAGLNAVQVIDFYANGDFIGSVRNNNDPGTGRFRAVFEWQPPSAGNFDVRAAARGVAAGPNFTGFDNYVVLSAPRTLKVSAATAAPAVSFLSPANNTTFAPNTQVVVTAQAVAATGRRITRVDFYVNGEPALEDTSAPFSLPLTLPTPGGYLVTAVATDSSNRSSSAQITLNAKAPTGGEPVVAVTQPLGESRFVFGSELFLNMTASDRGGSIKAGSTQFYLNGEARAAAFAFNNAYAATYVSSTTTPVLEISAVAEDNSGNVTVSRGPRLDFIQATRPLPLGVEVLPLPANTSTPVGGLIPLRATAIFPANAGEEKRVDFFVDGVYVGTGAETAAGSNIYTYSWRAPSQPASGKSYEVQARALALNTTVTTGQDNKEEVKYYSSVVSSNPTPFIVTTGTAIPPVARVTSPLGGATIPVGKEVSILADASATGSTIARVEFFVNGRSVGSSTQAPYSIKFTPPSKGVYNLAAVAQTASGLQAPSPTVSVTVVEAGPSQVPAVTILSPRSGQTFVPGSSVTVRSEALSPSFFPIESVAFYVNDVLVGTSTSASSSGEYAQQVNLPSQGNYFLKVVASDIYGNTGFAESVIISRIGSGPAPVVDFTVPAQNTDYVMDSEIYLNVTATDADGPVTSVKFFANNAEIKGSAVKRLGNTYSVRWKIPAADQSFVLHATATDGRGNSTSSDPVTIVTAPRINPLPTLTLLSPVTPTEPGKAMTLRARATFPPEAATGAAVQFYADGALVGTGQKGSGDIYELAWTPPAGATLDDLGAVASAVNYATGRTFLGAKLAQTAVGKDKPVINSPSTWTAAVGLAKTYRITATNGPLVSFRASLESGAALPSWMTLDAATGIITATAPKATTTPLKLRVTATNLGGVTSDPFIITFTAIAAPTITSSSTWEMTVGKVNNYQILTSVPATSYALVGPKPPWMTSFNATTGLITANPATSIADTVLQLTAGNAAGNGPVFNLAVRTPVPRIIAPASVIAPPGVTTKVRMQASGAPTSWSKKIGPAWVTISASGELSALPPSGGIFTAVLTASNIYGPSPDFTVTIDASTPPGSAVATFNTGAGANAAVLSVAPDLTNPDGLFYIGGSFTQYAGQAAGRLARLKADGAQDAAFAPGAGPNSAVTALAVQPSDKRLLVGGEFTRFNGAVAGRLVRLLRTGAVDSTFIIGTGANAPIRAIAVQKDGRILLAGEFTTFNGQPAPYITRLNANGSVDATFKPGLGPNNRVNAIALANDGKIYIGGWFAAVDGRDAGRIARLNADGSFDVSFDTRGGVSNTAASAATDPFNPGIGTTGTVNALALLSSGRLIVGGDFNTAAGDVPSYRLAAFDSNGLVVREFSFNAPCDKPVDTLVAEADGRVVAGGAFSLVGNPVQNRAGIARFSAVGAVEASFRSPFPAAVTSVVSALAVQPNGNILAGGNFRSVQGATQVRVAMLYGKDATASSAKRAGPTALNGQVGQRLLHQIGATGTPTFRLASGSQLPAGLALRATTGVLAGTPTIAGTYRFTVETVSGGSVLPLAFTVVIKP